MLPYPLFKLFVFAPKWKNKGTCPQLQRLGSSCVWIQFVHGASHTTSTFPLSPLPVPFEIRLRLKAALLNEPTTQNSSK